jgi:L-histidine N-alpha-methyltransferase
LKNADNGQIADMTNTTNNTFAADVIRGLKEIPKRLNPKYFYDSEGDKLFQEIMDSPEYYLTDCEMEIFTDQVAELSRQITCTDQSFDLIELGPGDWRKIILLLRQLDTDRVSFSYFPIDISPDIKDNLEIALPVQIPGRRIKGYRGEYIEMLKKAVKESSRRKVILCLGANIGNMTKDETMIFIKEIHSLLSSGDILVTGFDLIKHPKTIRNAYDDASGVTSRFNLNLLHRINRELGANFEVSSFEHYCNYEPETGSCKSFLISLKAAEVQIGKENVTFTENEFIWTEISQKYTLKQTEELAYECGFFPSGHLVDRRNWFADTIWVKI